MTPSTATFGDAALLVGNTFTDNTYGINVTVTSATSGVLNVQVRTPGSSVYTSDTLFVAQLYRDFLGREGSSGEISPWVSQLGSGVSRAQVVDQFMPR